MPEARMPSALYRCPSKVRTVSALLVMVLVIMSSFASETDAFGIRGRVLKRAVLQEDPGKGKEVMVILIPWTNVNILCKRIDPELGEGHIWLKLHVWERGSIEGYVPDYMVYCYDAGSKCRVSYCTIN